jgi:signal transduction histidine kinase
MRPAENRSLRHSIIVVIGLLFIVFMATMVIVVTVRGRNAESRFWQERLEETAINAARSVADHLENAFISLGSLGSLYGTTDLDLEGVADESASHPLAVVMQAMVDANPALDEIAVTRQAGSLGVGVKAARIQQGPILCNPELFWQEEWPFGVSNEIRWMSDLRRTASGEPYVFIGISLPGERLVAARVNMTTLQETVDAIDVGETGNAFVAARNGDVILHLDGAEAQRNPDWQNTPTMGTHPALDPQVTGTGKVWSGSFVNFANQPVFANAVAIPGTNWVLFAEINQGELTAFSQNTLILFGTLITFFFVCSFWIINRLLGRLIFTPLDNLYRSARQVSAEQPGQAVPILRHDEIGSVTGAYNDMLERLRAQTADLRATRDEALEHDRLKSRFLATMSHELRTPLNAIDGYASLMLMGAGGEIDTKAKEMVERIQTNGKELLSLINDVLDWSRLEAGSTAIQFQPICLDDLVDRWEDQISLLATSKGLQFTSTFAPDIPVLVYSDESALTRIALNLLSNAVKFTQAGSVTLALGREGDHLTLTVRDTGIGIPPEAQQIIFEEFRQADESTTRNYGGSGLGLAIARRMTALIGGSLQLESKVGAGSTFTVRLPIKPVSATD